MCPANFKAIIPYPFRPLCHPPLCIAALDTPNSYAFGLHYPRNATTNVVPMVSYYLFPLSLVMACQYFNYLIKALQCFVELDDFALTLNLIGLGIFVSSFETMHHRTNVV